MKLPIAMAAALLASCTGTGALQVYSEPPGARVMANGEYVGNTPLSIPFEMKRGAYSGEWMPFTVTLEAVPTREMAQGGEASGSVQARVLRITSPRDMKVFFDMGLQPGPNIRADVNVQTR